MNVQDFFTKDQIESRPNPGLKLKRWVFAMLFVIFFVGLTLIIALYGNDKELMHKYPASIIFTSVVLAFAGVLFFAMFIHFLEKPGILHHFPTIQLPIFKIDEFNIIVKNLKSEEEVIPMKDVKRRFKDNLPKAHIKLSGTLESPEYTLVTPTPPI